MWFNSPSRILNLSKNFELEYMGLSGKDLARNVSKLNKQITPKPCILVTPPWLVKPFLDPKFYSCFGLMEDLDSGFTRPFWVVKNIKNLKRGKFYNCDLIYESKFNFLFSKEDIIAGKLLKCI